MTEVRLHLNARNQRGRHTYARQSTARLIVLGSVTETGLSLHCLANALTPNTANAGELKLAGHYTVAGSAACSWSLWLTSMLCHLRMTFA
jgi:hypothetical protein